MESAISCLQDKGKYCAAFLNYKSDDKVKQSHP